MLSGINSNAEDIGISWNELKDYLNPLPELNILFRGNNSNDNNPSAKSHYLTAILYDQFARRLPREMSLENLGMVSLTYPKLQKTSLPFIAECFDIKLDEWRSLLKIAIDYIIRYQFHFSINGEIYPYSTTFLRSQLIYSSDSDEINAKKGMVFDRHQARPNRLALLICAGLGFMERKEIDNEMEDKINELLEVIWRTIKTQVLSVNGSGFILNLEEASQFQLTETLWLCPVKRRLLDAQFRGFSPLIKGAFTEENIHHYKIEKTIRFPEFPYPFNLNEENNINVERTRQWISENTQTLREQGVWNNIHERIIL
jgi:DEAD/DEAH box helicase domain-containing protein